MPQEYLCQELKYLKMLLARCLRISFRRKDYRRVDLDNQEDTEVIESVESYCPCVMKAKLVYFFKPRQVEFERSRAPSPESITTMSAEDVSDSGEVGAN